jgi:hypothetical protein
MLGMGNVQIAKPKAKSKEGDSKEMGDKVVKGSFIGSLIRRRKAEEVVVEEQVAG